MFEILWPCAHGLAKAKRDEGARVPPWRQQAAVNSGSVLLVEDEKALRVSVAKFLRKNGFSVAEASDGSAAIELFRTGGANIDLVLLDLTIPGTSSRDVIAEVRRMEPHTRLILTSAYELEKALAPSDTPQFATFIRKPFQLSDLLKLLQDCLSAKSSTSG